MTQLRLKHCMVFHINQERTDTLDLNSIAKGFARANERGLLVSDIFNQKKISDHIKIDLHAYNEFYQKY